jgi:RNA polymerase sigma factor (sigma-70 family)
VTEQQLIEKCILGERSAQHQLYQRYSKAMYTTAYRICGDFESAAEVLQDAFLQVFRHLGDFEHRSTIGAWIKAIVVRTALRKLERQKAPFLEIPEHYYETNINWDAVPLDTEYLEKAINALPEGARAVFVLAEVEGFGHKEIAEMLQISEGTSKSQLHYAKKCLRKILVTA